MPGDNLTVRADSGFYAHSVVSVCRKMDVRFPITIRQFKSLHNVIKVRWTRKTGQLVKSESCS